MKKFYTFLMAVVVAAVSFAQGEKGMKIRTMPTTKDFGKHIVAKPVAKKGVKAKVRKETEIPLTYVKVNTVPDEWEGQYLIVYEEGGYALNGGLTDKLDVAKNTITVTIDDEEIASTTATDKASFTIAETDDGYTIKGAGGLYMGWNSTEKNGLNSSKETAYLNNLAIDGEGNADIIAECGSYLRYNASSGQERFRYFKASTYTNQKPVVLYKLGGEKTEPVGSGEVVELPEGVEPEDWYMTGTMYVWDGDGWETNDMTATIAVAIDGNDIYVQGMSYWFEDAWLKGTIEDEKVLFPSNQLMGVDDYGDDLIVAFDSETDEAAEYLEFDLDTETNTLTMVNYYGEADKIDAADGIYNYCDELIISQNEVSAGEPVEVPEDLVTETYLLTAKMYVEEDDEEEEEEWDDNGYGVRREEGDDDEEGGFYFEDYSYQMQVGFDGQDVYFKGFDAEYTYDFWAKGTLSEDGKRVIIPAGQYLGTIDMWIYTYNLYLTSVNEITGELQDIEFYYDADAHTFQTDQWVVLNGSPTKLQALTMLKNVVISKMTEFAATPADPEVVEFDGTSTYPSVEFNIPTRDVNGNEILAAKLYYVIWIEKNGVEQMLTLPAGDYKNLTEDMTEIPYNFTDDYDIHVGGYVYLDAFGTEEVSSWTKIGVQSIYYGGGECHKSNVVWATIEEGTYDAIGGVATASQHTEKAIYNLAGQRVEKPTKGIYVVNGKKVIVK